MKKSGVTLVELMVVLGIMAGMSVIFGQMMFSQSRESKAMSEKMATMDFQRLLGNAITPSVCTWHLTDVSQKSPTNRPPVDTIDATTAATLAKSTIQLQRLRMAADANAPVLVEAGKPVSPIASSVWATGIEVRNITGSGDFFSAELAVDFHAAKLIRALPPAIVKIALQTDPASPKDKKRITSCSLIRADSQPGTIVVRHSMAARIPSCPDGYSKLWDGFSFAFSGGGQHSGGSQDLGKSGSCLEDFAPMPFMECRTDGNSEKCKKSSGDDWSYWLTAKTSDANILVSPPQPLYMLMSQISRCAVCKSASPQAIIVKHKTAPGYPLLPDCPAGSTRLWSGYSFLMGAGTQSGERIIADLSSTGSCLERFQPIPFVECKQEEGSGKLSCDFLTQGDFGYWMVRTGPTSKFGDITGSWVEPNVATCVVCAYSQ